MLWVVAYVVKRGSADLDGAVGGDMGSASRSIGNLRRTGGTKKITNRAPQLIWQYG